MNVNGKKRLVETTAGIGGIMINENDRGVNSTMIYLTYGKNLCKCYNVSPGQQ
jgi:hypothetical protein